MEKNAAAGAPALCWVIALVGLVLTARISDRSHERIAVGVGIASALLAARAFAVIFGKLERRRRSS